MRRSQRFVSFALASCQLLAACGMTANTPVQAGDAQLRRTANYAADGGDAAPTTPPELARAVRDAAAQQQRTLAPDARLDQLAAWAAAHEPAPASALELAARQLGLYDPHFSVLSQSPGAPLSAALTRKLPSEPFTHYGAAWQVSGGERRAWIVLAARRIVLEPLPSSLPLEAGLRLRARVPDAFGSARVELISEEGRVLVPVGHARELSVQLPTKRPGLHRITIIGDGAHGEEILAKLPVYVGMPFPSESARGEPRDYEPSAVARLILDSMNRERTKAGLPALLRDARLDKLAEQHNVDMRAHDFVGHVSALTGNATERVERAGLPTALVLETIARGSAPSALEVSPTAPASELRNVLSAAVTHVGIGVMTQHDAHGPLLAATEIFVALPEHIEPATAKPRLLSLVNEARARRGVPTLVLDTGLCSVADQAAERFMRDPTKTEQAVLTETDREISHFSLAYRRVSSLLVTARQLQDAAALEAALDPAASGIGLGIVQGERGGKSVLTVVMLVGSQR